MSTPPPYNPLQGDENAREESFQMDNNVGEIDAIIANKRRLSETLIESGQKLSVENKSKLSEVVIETKKKASSSSLSMQTLKEFANSSHRASGANLAEPEEIVALKQKSFIYSFGLSSAEADTRLHKYGRNELPEKIIPKWYIFLSQLWQPMPIMIWMAIIIEAGIQNWIDMSVLLLSLIHISEPTRPY